MSNDRQQHRMATAAVATAASGSIAGIFTELLFYGLDSYKIARQAGESVQLSRLFRGALPLAVLGSGPTFGVFFLLYTPSSEYLKAALSGVADPSVAVLLASACSAIPASLVGVPADFVKKQVIIADRSIFQVLRTNGLSGMFVGWQINLLREIPFAGLKMSLYDTVARLYRHNNESRSKDENALKARPLSSVESAGVGFVSGVITAVLTCPLDCINTRIKSGELAHISILRVPFQIVRQDGILALFRGLAPRSTILGLGSTVFWYFQTAVKGCITTDIDRYMS